MNQRWRLLALWLLPIGVVLLIGWQVVSNGAVSYTHLTLPTSFLV